MTTEELHNLISRQIGESFDLSKELIQEQLFKGATEDMTEQEVYAHMFLQSMSISANISAQVVINTLVEMNIISPELLSSLKVKPQLHLVKSSMVNNTLSSENREE